MDLPYRAEYAKSGRSSCRGCKSSIQQASLRLAVMVQSPTFDAKVPNWYHYTCFFNKQRPKTVDDISHFEDLRIADQDKIRELIEKCALKGPAKNAISKPEFRREIENLPGGFCDQCANDTSHSLNLGNLYCYKRTVNVSSAIVPDKKGKGKKRDAASAAAKKSALKDFKIEYAKSGRAMCRGCEQKILKDEIRISKKDFETEVGMKYGGQDMWHHLTCFAKLRSELGYFESADKLPGFQSLNKEDQADAKKQVGAIKQEDIPEAKKAKIETTTTIDGFTPEQAEEYAKQNKIIFQYRDQLESLHKDELIELMEENGQKVPSGKDRILNNLADTMTFGGFKPCTVCKKQGHMYFDKFGYRCSGAVSGFTKCNTLTKEPERVPFVVPEELREAYPFLKKYKYIPRVRVCKEDPNKDVKKEDEVDGPKVARKLPALYNMDFVILGKPVRGKDELKKQITKLGGKVITKISPTVMAVFASKAEVEKMGARITEAQTCQVHVVPEEFIDEADKHSGKIPELIIEKTVCDWGSDPNTRLPPEPSTSNKSGKSKSRYEKSGPSKITLKLKDGGAVDPDSGLDDIAHIYKEGKDKYAVAMVLTDIQSQSNKFYKIQLLEHDKGNGFWVFRSWGRIGTTIGANKLTKCTSLYEAKDLFCKHYEEKSGNHWEDRHNFVKRMGHYQPLDLDYGEDEAADKLDISDVPSKLHKSVQHLMRLIFDVNLMKKVMLEFELDTEKMPLGKLSKKQIQNAYSVLSEIQKMIDQNKPEINFIDASNRFYSLVPHSFGVENPPVLKDPDVIKQKLDMLENLMELEIAYNLMKSSGSDHSVDGYYQKLNTEIDVLQRESEEFKIIQEYIENTHAETHKSYKLEIEDVYTIKRQGEDKRFKPFKKLHNHKLLWHGSRVTNYAGILAQGLRIAPPEAPVTGYMFGKGIYFADMVSKSANYCCTSMANSTGLLLLCDVALGNTYERKRAEYVEKLPKGKHSTKGLGRTHPNPEHSKYIEGIEVPCGKGVQALEGASDLLYNEYIVYDVAQVQVKYLLKVKFQYNY